MDKKTDEKVKTETKEPSAYYDQFNLPAAAVFQIQMIALADDEMVKRPGAAEAYRSIARHTLDLFKKQVPQPEPEESQEVCVIDTNRWTKKRTIFPRIFSQAEAEKHISSQSTENKTFEIFTIQRKKQ